MIEGIPLIDVHVHAARTATLKVPWDQWIGPMSSDIPFDDFYDDDGAIDPAAFDAYEEREGVDIAFLMAEYSPRVTGIQSVEDMLPLVEYNPRRFRFIGALNPGYHHPLVEEFERQQKLGAVGLKIHPVHSAFPPNHHELYPVYWLCQERGVPVVFHCGTSVFPGATNRFGDPVLIDDIARDFPQLTIVLAHGGRGWWYDAAAFLTYAHENVWIEISGLPPQRLPDYYARHDLTRLGRKFIFGSDFPAIPGQGHNARKVLELELGDEVTERVLWRNAVEVYRLHGDERVREWTNG